MRTTIDSMIDSVCRCVKCNAKMGECDCWVQIRCPHCKKFQTTARDKTDPPGTAVVQTCCPDCHHGDFAEVLYFDASGKQLEIE